jgi:hypothetical protein
MRTTLDIDDDVLAAAKELAFRQNTTTGRAISDLARRALAEASLGKPTYHHGLVVLPRRGGTVAPELVDRLAEDEP